MHVIVPAVKMRKTGHVKLVISAVHSKMYVTKDLHVGLQSLNVANPQSAVLCEEHRWTTIFAIVQIVRTWSWPSAKRHINTQILQLCTYLYQVDYSSEVFFNATFVGVMFSVAFLISLAGRRVLGLQQLHMSHHLRDWRSPMWHTGGQTSGYTYTMPGIRWPCHLKMFESSQVESW